MSNDIIHKALDILIKLEHRGAVSSDGRTGDGAGILFDIPHDFFKKVCDFEIPEAREYAVGMVFLPKSKNQVSFCMNAFESTVKDQNLKILGWRDVPVDVENLGQIAAEKEPTVKQVFVSKNGQDLTEQEFNAKLFAARKIAEHAIRGSKTSESHMFYFTSLSTTTIIYKGLLMPEDISRYYIDLKDPDLVTRLALVHQRFSTNTFPSWDLAQPFRYMCHNGEINTLRGNGTQRSSKPLELSASNFAGFIARNRLVLVDFWAPWCGPCRGFAPIFDEASAAHPEIAFAKVNTETQPDLAQAARIASIPTLMAFKDGILVHSKPGALSSGAMEQLLVQLKHLDAEIAEDD